MDDRYDSKFQYCPWEEDLQWEDPSEYCYDEYQNPENDFE